MGSRNNWREIWGKLTDHPAIAVRELRKGSLGNQEKHKHAEAFSPGCAVPLSAALALLFSFLQHLVHLSKPHKVCGNSLYDSVEIEHGQGQSFLCKLL